MVGGHNVVQLFEESVGILEGPDQGVSALGVARVATAKIRLEAETVERRDHDLRTKAWRAIDAEALWSVREDDGRAAAREWDAQEHASAEGGLVVEEHRHLVSHALLVVGEAEQRCPDLVEHRLVIVGVQERALLLGLRDAAPEADGNARGEVLRAWNAPND